MTGDEAAGGAGAGSPDDVLAFWRAAGPDKWFEKDPPFDAEITRRFLATWDAAVAGQLAAWEDTPECALALVIVLDQFPRNMFRGLARMYASDPLALAATKRTLARSFDEQVPRSDRQFFYLPLEHSENLDDQERCVALARRYGDDEFTKYAEQHADIIRRFGRFPHRNAVLGRAATSEEQAFLDGGGFAG